ncbi:MAG: hypothetical protein A4S14_14595 [Proteobacteria bacterium SG_bin9]|nr:MAG: hypothetical protein A4S14_14595 [Proteobacteria bacterium SG_bin9]
MTDELSSQSEGVREVPKRALDTYARLWQLETWLRRMVYVELRALRGDAWSRGLKKSTSFEADKRLKHMPTPEMNALSYAQLSELTQLIGDNWKCFESYLPPQDLWDAKLKEIKQIRHRIAHFRRGHHDDFPRLIQFMRDIDLGFWTFCTSFNNAQAVLPQDRDSITTHFLPRDPLPWVEIEEKKWAQVGFVNKSLVLGMSVQVGRRLWAERVDDSAGKPGHFYDFTLSAMDGRLFEYSALLERTQHIHQHVIYICLSSSENSLRVTLPALLGAPKIIEIMELVVEIAEQEVSRSRSPIALLPEALADEWPEYVLGPSNPLTFLDPGMKCSFFDV